MEGFVRIAIVAGAALLVACGGPKEDQLRTVKSYEFAVCDSTPTTDATQLEAIRAFKSDVQDRYFIRRRDSAFAANHESTADASGVREYEGPFYIYVHPRNPEKQEVARGVEWASTVFLHADKVRSRVNGQQWGEWNAVRTRNFSQSGRTVEGLGRWKCLLGAEIAWAHVTRANGTWTVTPAGVSVYDVEEIRRALPLPAKTQIEGEQPVEAL
jgi:hypothetical protein